jgi:hypothetical protein
MFFSSCCDKDSAIIFTTACLMSTLLETGVGANAAFRSTEELEILNFGYHPLTDH